MAEIPRAQPPGLVIGPREARFADVVAGVSVALVLIPQSLAYAELAGMPPVAGLYAGALPPIVASLFASSPYLQTGPVAIVSLLTFTSLSGVAEPGSDEFVSLALLLALMIGALWLLVGLLRASVVAYLMSEPMLMGFIPAAALVIAASQLPIAVGADPPSGSVISEAGWVVSHPGSVDLAAVLLAVTVLVLMLGGRRVHALFPGVLIAVAFGIAYAEVAGYDGELVGDVPVSAPPISLDLPWGEVGSLVLPAVVICLVGIAEAGSIARTFAALDRRPWSSHREFLSQGLANVTAGASGGYPVCGSFSRSALNRLSGAASRWSGAITGIVVLAFLPFASVLESLPKAILGAIVIGAVLQLIKLVPIVRLWRLSKPQFAVAAITFVATLAFSEHVDYALLIGIALAVGVHLWRELDLDVGQREEAGTVHLSPRGVLWYGAAQGLQDEFLDLLARRPELERVVLHLEGLGRIDVTGAIALRNMLREARSSEVMVELRDVPPHAQRLVSEVVEAEQDPIGRGH